MKKMSELKETFAAIKANKQTCTVVAADLKKKGTFTFVNGVCESIEFEDL